MFLREKTFSLATFHLITGCSNVFRAFCSLLFTIEFDTSCPCNRLPDNMRYTQPPGPLTLAALPKGFLVRDIQPLDVKSYGHRMYPSVPSRCSSECWPFTSQIGAFLTVERSPLLFPGLRHLVPGVHLRGIRLSFSSNSP